jgi:hypothetical protein
LAILNSNPAENLFFSIVLVFSENTGQKDSIYTYGFMKKAGVL